MNEQRAVLVDGRYNSDFHKGLVNAIARGLEAARKSGFGDSGTVNRIADVVTHHLLTTRPEPAADAVERHPMQGEVWSIIRRAMDTPYRARFERDAIGSEAARKVIATLQAAAVEPEPGLSLDELLDDVEAAFVSILWREDVGRHEVVMHGHSSAWFARGTGKTRTEALAAAVRQAKENGDG